MTNFDSLLINKEAPDRFWVLISPYQSDDEPLLFAVMVDLDLNAHYGQGAVVVGKKGFFVLDIEKGTVKEFAFSDIKSSKIKRMYSNAYLEIEKKSGEKEIVIRFTFSVASLMDMTSKFISSVAGGNDVEGEMQHTKSLCACAPNAEERFCTQALRASSASQRARYSKNSRLMLRPKSGAFWGALR